MLQLDLEKKIQQNWLTHDVLSLRQIVFQSKLVKQEEMVYPHNLTYIRNQMHILQDKIFVIIKVTPLITETVKCG